MKYSEGYRAVFWHPDDIIKAAKDIELGIEITPDIAASMLDAIIQNHDPVDGITWYTIHEYLRDYKMQSDSI